MPSPFARTLPSKKSSTTWLILGLISVAAVVLVGYNYLQGQRKPVMARTSTIPQNEMRALVISSNGFVDLPNNVPYDENSMYYSTAGLQSQPLFFLVRMHVPSTVPTAHPHHLWKQIHGEGKGSSSRDWQHLFEVLATQGTYYAPDCMYYAFCRLG